MRKSRKIDVAGVQVNKPSGLKLDGTPNAPWQKFKERLDNFESVQLSDWKYDQFLGYLLKRYREHYSIDFSLSFSGPPTKSSEIYCIKRMLSTLGTEDPTIVKAFIDWSFDKVIIPKNMDINSLAFFFTVNIIRDFKSKYKKVTKITRATPVSAGIKNIMSSIDVDDVETYGELAFAKRASESNPDRYKKYTVLFDQLTGNGFDLSILDVLED